MNIKQFKHLVQAKKTYVICPKRATEMEQGWDDEMDDMVGIPLRVEEKGPNFVFIRSANGNTYMFGYKYIELFAAAKKEVRLGANIFSSNALIPLPLLDSILLEPDRKKLRSVKLNTEKTGDNTFEISSEILEEIQNKCPRVIGALLSHKIMERVV